ncbi:MAG: 6-phosphofructokinase [Eubacteriales bacterium]|nr:6-phosphofructokinase [Eubacteriales bacterium]
MLRIAMLTSGGDCQALNVAMRGVAKTLYKNVKDVEIYGFMDGYKGMMYKKYRLLKEKDFSGILTQGGTILGTSRTPFKTINVPDLDGNDKVELMIKTYKELKLDCLVVLGGNGSHKTANLLYERGLNVITLPKTIDNDLFGTDMSFGFQSAIDIAANTIDCIHTTAASHSRVFIVELMGHKTGWLTLYAGIAGGADIILIPEIPYSIDSVISAIKSRTENGKRFTIIAVAEGAVTKDEAKLTKKELKKLKEVENFMYPSAAYKLGAMITEATGQEVRVTVPGHVQRGGQPNAYDRVLATRLGVKAAELIMEGKYGMMPCVRNNSIETIPLGEVAGKTRMLEPDADIILQARQLGLCLGD